MIEIEILIEILHLNYVTDKANKAKALQGKQQQQQTEQREICHATAQHTMPCHISGSPLMPQIGSPFINKVQRVLDLLSAAFMFWQ